MGFGDLLKKTIEEALKREAEQKKQEQEKIKQEQEKIKQEQIAKILAPTCERGDCLWYRSKFYFTCPEDCECERKKFTKKDWGGNVDMVFWPYMKRLDKLEKYDFDGKKEIYKDFMTEFLPQYGVGQYGLAEIITTDGFKKEENPLIDIMFAIAQMDKMSDMNKKVEFIRYNCMRPVLEHEVFKKKSLYDRSYEDFEYTVKILNNVLNEYKLSQYFIDISNISVEQLYDENGDLKQAGIGGPEAGFYGDTIYNTVEMWAGENGENNRANQ